MKKSDTKIFKIYGENLKRIRELKHVSLKDLSLKSKISEQYLRKIEKGIAYGLTTTKIFIIAEALETKPHFFFEGI